MRPVAIRKSSGRELSIDWDDAHSGRHTFAALRDHCPCAGCTTESGHNLLPILTPGKYDLQSLTPIGNYAIQIGWGDGHRTGIYTYEHLRRICECLQCSPAGVR